MRRILISISIFIVVCVMGYLLCFFCFVYFINNHWLNQEPKKVYYKYIRNTDMEVGWYYPSLLTNKPPDYVNITTETDTVVVCQADNISDIILLNDSVLVIHFCGRPTLYWKNIEIPNEKLGIKIAIDTNRLCQPNKERKAFFRETEID